MVSDEKIVAALISTKTVKEAASRCGLCLSQMYERMGRPALKQMWAQARSRLLDEATAESQRDLRDAVGVMAEVMRDDSASPQVRLNAADAVVRSCLRLTEQNDLIHRIERLEGR